MPLIAVAGTSIKAWSKLTRLFANRSQTRVMQLKETLTLSKRGDLSISDYLQSIKSAADQLVLINSALSNDDLTLHILNSLGPDFCDIVAPIRN